MLTAIEIKDHLMASDIVVVDSNESNRIITRLTKKGLRILEVRLASCLLICIFLKSPRINLDIILYYPTAWLIYGVPFAKKRLWKSKGRLLLFYQDIW